MFQKNKNSYRTTVICINGNKIGTYTFIESSDDDWSNIASQMFYNEFGFYPTEMRVEIREVI